MFRHIWNLATGISAAYSIYNTMKNISSAKDELYNQLAPQEQAQWKQIFGDPNIMSSVRVPNPVIPFVPGGVPASSEGKNVGVIQAPSQISGVRYGI